MIHPTAQVHPQAKLHPTVKVGAYAVIDGPAQIGEGCTIEAHAILLGRITMGRENTVGHGAVLGGDPQDFSFNPETESHVQIGDRNRIREHCTIHRGTQSGTATVIGDDCFVMVGCHLAHNVRLGNRVVMANNVLLAGHVTVDDGAFLGGGCVFHQFIRIGRLAIAQGGGAFGKDIPPFTLAARVNGIGGLNVVGLRRAGYSAEQRSEIKRAFALLYLSGLNTSQALAAAESQDWSPEASEFFTFVAAAKKRGICPLLRKAVPFEA